MTTFTSEDRENAKKLVDEAPYHPGYEEAVVYPTVIVDSGASVRTLGDFIDKENREDMLREQLHIMQAEIQRLRKKLMEAGIND